MTRSSRLVTSLVAAALAIVPASIRAQAGAWRFVVSGDARNCGDVIAPAIAETAAKNNASFYWHLGDLRWNSDIDEDIRHQPEYVKKSMTVAAYISGAYTDFIESQIVPFGKTPYFIGIGNHELTAGKTRQDYLLAFTDWLDSPVIREQRLKDNAHDWQMKTYYHWIDRGVDFIFLDNASNDMFDSAQLRWFENVLKADTANPAIHTIVAGMHKPLPEGYSLDHGMNESPTSTETGRRAYADLLKAQTDGHKHVYVLASHQHFFMPDAYDTPYWKEHGGVLPGWIVGTAGAVRYSLPKPSPAGAMTNVYGSLVGTVQTDGTIGFAFAEVKEADLPKSVTDKYGAEFTHWCFAENSSVK